MTKRGLDENMKILALEYKLPSVTVEKYKQYADAEALRIWELHQEGVIREVHFRADRNEMVLTLECENVESARKALRSLPSDKQGLLYFELIPLKTYTGFECLFQSEKAKGHDQNS
jgi:hypothetical protein